MQKGQSDSSLPAQSTGEESNSSDISDRGGTVTPKTEPSDYPMMDERHPLLQANGGDAANLMDQARQHNFPSALLGLSGKILKYFNLTCPFLFFISLILPFNST